jgi:chromate reductase, NAD(P)H dehydrogenase (quinone)
MKNVLAISGSTRKGSTNESILKTIGEKYQGKLNVGIYNEIDALPHFNPDLDKEQVPEVVNKFRQLIQQSDGVIICTPEYVFSLPGALKNALEWTVSTVVFSYKPIALIVASADGKKAMESLNIIMSTLIQKPIGAKAQLLIQGGRSKINTSGNIDPSVLAEIDEIVSNLISEIEAYKRGKAE